MNLWSDFIENEAKQDYFKNLTQFVSGARQKVSIYPKEEDVFNAFKMCSFDNTNVVILGQDPYHGENQAHGLSFSVSDEKAKFPPSLRNIFKELEADLGIKRTNRNLADWAIQGILLLNTALTVEAAKAGSHRGKGWEIFTDRVINHINSNKNSVIFVLWGNDARKKTALIDTTKHIVIESAHPSPLSAHNGFFGSRPFSKINEALRKLNKPQINW